MDATTGDRLSFRLVATFPLPRFSAHAERAKSELKIAEIILEAGVASGGTVSAVARATLAGDARRLRGVPVVGHGVTGCVPGSNPVGALLAKERSRRR